MLGKSCLDSYEMLNKVAVGINECRLSELWRESKVGKQDAFCTEITKTLVRCDLNRAREALYHIL